MPFPSRECTKGLQALLESRGRAGPLPRRPFHGPGCADLVGQHGATECVEDCEEVREQLRDEGVRLGGRQDRHDQVVVVRRDKWRFPEPDDLPADSAQRLRLGGVMGVAAAVVKAPSYSRARRSAGMVMSGSRVRPSSPRTGAGRESTIRPGSAWARADASASWRSEARVG